jgi:hypothetical protein
MQQQRVSTGLLHRLSYEPTGDPLEAMIQNGIESVSVMSESDWEPL